MHFYLRLFFSTNPKNGHFIKDYQIPVNLRYVRWAPLVVMIFVTTSTIVQLILVIREKGKKKFPRRKFCQAIESDGESVNIVSNYSTSLALKERRERPRLSQRLVALMLKQWTGVLTASRAVSCIRRYCSVNLPKVHGQLRRGLCAVARRGWLPQVLARVDRPVDAQDCGAQQPRAGHMQAAVAEDMVVPEAVL